ncbi:hypothetical protein IM40_06755 [Candidatus Paracaedimonas acanthamoebae]|nr:hypothetical protein IM40_06755 [Candidatus Paracaedimonas acanthamoebae]
MINIYVLSPLWGTDLRDEQQALSSAATSYLLKMLPDDVMALILSYVSGPTLNRLWETGDKTMQQRLSQNAKVFEIGKTQKQLVELSTYRLPKPKLPFHFLEVIVSRYSALINLDISRNLCDQDALETSIPSLTHLRALNLYECGLTILPQNFSKLVNLTELNVGFNWFVGGVLPTKIFTNATNNIDYK